MEKRISKHVFTWVGAFLFGEIGVDRFMRGQIGIGILKLVLFGLCAGVASLVSFFTFGMGAVLIPVFMAPIYIWWFIDWIIALTKLGKYKSDFVFASGKWAEECSKRLWTDSEKPKEKITYTSKEGLAYIESDGKITITGYSGEAKDVIIPDIINDLPVAFIGSEAFRNKQLISIAIPKSVVSIGESAFRDNEIAAVVIPESVIAIGGWAFKNNQLTSVTIPGAITVIEDGVFAYNKLASVIIPNIVTRIGNWAFFVNSLSVVVIPDSVSNIGSTAFEPDVKLQGGKIG